MPELPGSEIDFAVIVGVNKTTKTLDLIIHNKALEQIGNLGEYISDCGEFLKENGRNLTEKEEKLKAELKEAKGDYEELNSEDYELKMPSFKFDPCRYCQFKEIKEEIENGA